MNANYMRGVDVLGAGAGFDMSSIPFLSALTGGGAKPDDSAAKALAAQQAAALAKAESEARTEKIILFSVLGLLGVGAIGALLLRR